MSFGPGVTASPGSTGQQTVSDTANLSSIFLLPYDMGNEANKVSVRIFNMRALSCVGLSCWFLFLFLFLFLLRSTYFRVKGDSDGGVPVKARSTARFIKPSTDVGNVG